MKIHVLEAGFRKRHPYKRLREALFRPVWFPVQNAKWELADLGHQVRFFAAPEPAMADCDVLILSSRTIDALAAAGAGARSEICARYAGGRRKLIWFDTRDSAGNGQFDVLPHVDIYWKKHLYKDRSTYTRPLYYGRVYSDYYHRTQGIEDVEQASEDSALISERSAEPYVPSERVDDVNSLAKLRLAWGCGAEFHWPLFNRLSFVGYFASAAARTTSPRFETRPVTVDPAAARDKTIAALFDDQRYSLKSVGHQRALGLEAARALPALDKTVGRVPRNRFYGTLASSQVSVSTFGWGEVCYREFEAAYCGSAILMADMSGVETFPSLYVPEEFYVPFRWDFSDFEETCTGLLNDPQRRLGMARRAQALVTAQWTKAGREAFARRFSGLIA